METEAANQESPSSWAPLKRPLFRNRWLAALVSNTGGWMQDTAGTWLMVALTSSPLLIALMQTAASLPVLLLGLPAGANADIFDRRRLLIFWQVWMFVSVLVLSVLALTGAIGPWTLLTFTFLLNVGNAMSGPAWQAIIPELVPRAELPDAVSINSAGYNLGRAVGPALGGLAVAAFVLPSQGAGAVFLFNSISFIGVVAVLYTWHRTPLFKSALPAERLLGSMRAGLRYVRHSPPLQSVLWRAFLFTSFASAVWALLAVVAQQDLQEGALGYGILNGCLGLGAVAGAAALPKTRRKLSPDRIVQIASVVFACTLLTLAFGRSVPLIVLSLIAAGFAWTSTTSTFNVAVQLSAPAWVQARTLGTYQMVFQGGMALGSAFWGFVAEHSTASKSLVAAAAGMLALLSLARRFHLPQGAPPDLSPYSRKRVAPEIVIEPRPEDGPVLVTVDYRIKAADHDAFIGAIHEMRDVRLRDGAIRWGVFQNAADPDRFTEMFVMDSWIEYLRQRERMTISDRLLRDRVWSFQQNGADPTISHMIYARQLAR